MAQLLGSNGPVQPATPDQGPAAADPQNAEGGLGAVAGYPETGSGAYRAGNDAVIRKAVADYNNRNGYRPGDPRIHVSGTDEGLADAGKWRF